MLKKFNLFSSSLDKINFETNRIINTINPHSYCEALKDNYFEEALKSSDILLPDGIGIVWAEKFLKGKSINKIAGNDIFLFLMSKLEKEKGSVFFLGSSVKTLNKIHQKCKIDFPNITVGSYSPPFKTDFSNDDSNLMTQKINDFCPDVLFVGMTAPKQEKWVHKNKHNIDVSVICSIGAVFDFYAGNSRRAPKFLIDLGLEWAFRSLTSFRLFKRNVLSNPKFIFHIIQEKLS